MQYKEKISFSCFLQLPPASSIPLKREGKEDLVCRPNRSSTLNDNRVTIKSATDKHLLKGESNQSWLRH